MPTNYLHPTTKGEASDLIDQLEGLIHLQTEQRKQDMEAFLSYDGEELS